MSWCPTTLVIGPGGVKGFLEVGALQALEFFLILKNIRRVVGVSVGSVVGLLVAAGFTPAEITFYALNVDLSREIFLAKPFTQEVFMSKNGFFSTAGIENYITKLIKTKFPHVPTMAELYELTKIELVVVATNITKCEPTYFSRLTTPNLSCIEAVLMSISIPLVFEYREMYDQRFVDGALTDPLPIQLYPNEDQLVLRIVDNANQGSDLLSYIYTTFSLSMEYMAKEKLTKLMQDKDFQRRCRIIELTASDFNPVNPLITTKEKENMINQGKKITATFIIVNELQNSLNAKPKRDSDQAQPDQSGGNFRRRLRPLSQLQGESATGAES